MHTFLLLFLFGVTFVLGRECAGAPLTLLNGPNPPYGASSSMAMIGGAPALLFHSDDDRLFYAWKSGPGDAWSTEEVGQGSGKKGWRSSLINGPSGNAVIGYVLQSSGLLKVVERTGHGKYNSLLPSLLGSEYPSSQYISLALVDETRIAMLYQTSSDYMKYQLRAADGSTWEQSDQSFGSARLQSPLQIVGLKPSVAYWNYVLSDLVFEQASSITGMSQWKRSEPDIYVLVQDKIGGLIALTNFDDKPFVAFAYPGDPEKMVVTWPYSSPQGYWDYAVIDSLPNTGNTYVTSLFGSISMVAAAPTAADRRLLVFYTRFNGTLLAATLDSAGAVVSRNVTVDGCASDTVYTGTSAGLVSGGYPAVAYVDQFAPGGGVLQYVQSASVDGFVPGGGQGGGGVDPPVSAPSPNTGSHQMTMSSAEPTSTTATAAPSPQTPPPATETPSSGGVSHMMMMMMMMGGPGPVPQNGGPLAAAVVVILLLLVVLALGFLWAWRRRRTRAVPAANQPHGVASVRGTKSRRRSSTGTRSHSASRRRVGPPSRTNSQYAMVFADGGRSRSRRPTQPVVGVTDAAGTGYGQLPGHNSSVDVAATSAATSTSAGTTYDKLDSVGAGTNFGAVVNFAGHANTMSTELVVPAPPSTVSVYATMQVSWECTNCGNVSVSGVEVCPKCDQPRQIPVKMSHDNNY